VISPLPVNGGLPIPPPCRKFLLSLRLPRRIFRTVVSNLGSPHSRSLPWIPPPLQTKAKLNFLPLKAPLFLKSSSRLAPQARVVNLQQAPVARSIVDISIRFFSSLFHNVRPHRPACFPLSRGSPPTPSPPAVFFRSASLNLALSLPLFPQLLIRNSLTSTTITLSDTTAPLNFPLFFLVLTLWKDRFFSFSGLSRARRK